MQFVANGPDVPEVLLDAHEDGRVVFFCGAGISYPAGLPGFKGLVDEIYRLVGTTPNKIEQKAYDSKRYDATLDLLERRLPGQRLAVRRALQQALKPKLRRKGATDTHAALLKLARSREGALRLVTTNFDHIFESVARRSKQVLNAYVAPLLPIPKNSRWDGLVYLHGLLPEKADDKTSLNNLVLTSGDFGLAYLTERWAARFVSELLHNYVVCFVGYSINDPVLRYMMDALAADRMLGEVTPQAYAFGDYKSDHEEAKVIEWESKGVTPILYKVPRDTQDHSALHRTLKVWAGTYRDGVLGKEYIVMKYALARPSDSTQQDNFVRRMLWALSDPSGLPAKSFAEVNPAPPLDWLEVFSDKRYRYSHLTHFGVLPRAEADGKLKFSLVHRPAPYTHAPWMSLVNNGPMGSTWDEVMFQLGRWLTRHLNDPALIIWVAQHGAQLHDHFIGLIERELERLARLEQEGKTTELEAIRADAPNAIPDSLMRTLWRLLLAGRVKSPGNNPDLLYRWKDRFQRDGLTATVRLELRELLAPKVTLRRPFRWSDEDRDQAIAPRRLSDLVDWELVLAADDVHSLLRDLKKNEHWCRALPMLLDDFQQLLRDAMDLLRELGDADDRHDRSYRDQPSISPHWQNRGIRDWVLLIELVRDAWLAVCEIDPARAKRVAEDWFTLPYPTFKRLALFAASQDGCIPPEQWVDWLTDDDAWWLWSKHTMRETMRLLVLQGASLTPDIRTKLEAAILAGPPRSMFREDLAPEDWQSIVDSFIWIRLAKLMRDDAPLGSEALSKLAQVPDEYSDWRAAREKERNEFLHWVTGTGYPDYEENIRVDIAPSKRSDLVEWLRKSPSSHRPFYRDNWREICAEHYEDAVFALVDLACEGTCPIDRWQEAFYVWGSNETLSRHTWCCLAPLIEKIPDDKLKELAHDLTGWLEKVSEVIDHRQISIFLEICRRILTLPLDQGANHEDTVSGAFNHPVGHVTQALLNIWFKRKPNDNDGLPDDIEPFFAQLCDIQKKQFRHGRVLLASQLIALFRVDREWTEKHLLPLFDWSHDSIEAKAVWEGFLWSPRLYWPLLIACKTSFLTTASHYHELGEGSRQQFAAFLTYAALAPPEGYTTGDFQEAFGELPPKGLAEAARALVQALKGAGNRREEYWRNRVQPFWRNIWPKSQDLVSKGIAEKLARLAIAAGGEFPAALSDVLDWLIPLELPHYVVSCLHKSGLAKKFPDNALSLLDAVIDDQSEAPKELGQCLGAITDASPTLKKSPQYRRLSDYARQRGVMK